MKTTRRGQIAISFVVLMGFILLLVRLTINIGQMSQVRVETANASDAAALAGASWMASGQNEAAWVSRKMWDAMWMTKAVYLVPLCPGGEHTLYAQRLWSMLERDMPSSGDPELCNRGDFRGCGPNGWWKQVANGAMFAAWNIGRREWFTALVNNMLLRYSTSNSNYGDLPETIRTMQQQFHDYGDINGAAETRTAPSMALPWTNGLPPGDPMYIEHFMLSEEQYPAMPLMATESRAEGLLPYLPGIPKGSPGFDFFGCEFVGLQGNIKTTSAGNDPGPLPALPQPLPTRPLAINPGTGAKEWDLDLMSGDGGRPIVPHIMDMYGTCGDPVCGITLASTGGAELVPSAIWAGEGTVYGKVEHHALAPFSGSPGQWGWIPKFQPVASDARAHFSTARVTSSGITDVPQRSATAFLESAN